VSLVPWISNLYGDVTVAGAKIIWCHTTPSALAVGSSQYTMMQGLIVLLLLALVSSLSVRRPLRRLDSWHRAVLPPRSDNNRQTTVLFSSRDEEIAKLEAQLRQLRENEEAPDGSTKEDDKLSIAEFEAAKRRLEMVKGKDMLLTEHALLSGGLLDNESKGGNLFGIVGAVVAVVFLLLFSQVPIGQENLARYSATGSSNVKSIDLGDLNPDSRRI
jgi:hypothetical protein